MSSMEIRKSRDGTEHMIFNGVIYAEKPGRRKRRRNDGDFSLELLRMREIEKVIKHRHGDRIPDPGDTDDRETCLDYVRAAAFTSSDQDMAAWCRVWAPWATEADILPIISAARNRQRMMRSDGVAGLLNVTLKENIAVGLKTIGACDVTRAERLRLAKDRKRERDRNAKAAKRKAEGRKNRKSYEAQSLSGQRPWDAEGISRRTWYRRRGTGVARVDIDTKCDTLVPNPNLETSQNHGTAACKVLRMPSRSPGQSIGSSEAGTDAEGLGDHPPAGCQGAEPHGRSEGEGNAA